MIGAIWTILLNGGAWCAGYWVARDGFRQPPGAPRWLATPLLAWAWVTIGMEALGGFGLLGRGPLLAWVGVGLLVGLGFRSRRRDPEAPASAPGERPAVTWEEVVAAALTLWAAAFLGLQSLFMPVKVISDAPIYHLYLAARWWKSGHLDLIATPFGENAAPYFPAVGDLWFTWLMIGWGGDRLAKVGQAPFLVLAGGAAYALARRLGARRGEAWLGTAWFLTCTPFFFFSFEANVDTLMVAGYLLAFHFFARFGLGDDGLGALALGALAAGLALATKAPGIIFVPPLIALGVALALWRGRGVAGKASGVATVVLTPLSVAGFWWGRNLWLTGNPLYPLHLVAFGQVLLPGWYGPEAMRLSPYYIPREDWRAAVDLFLAVADPRLAPLWLAAMAGAWAIGVKREVPEDRWVWACSALAALNLALFWLVVPYRTQHRFMSQAFGLAAIPLARLFGRGRVVRRLGLAMLVIHLFTGTTWPFDPRDAPWDLDPMIPNDLPPLILTLRDLQSRSGQFAAEPLALLPIMGSLFLGVISLIVVLEWSWAWRRPSPRRLARGLLMIGLLGVLAMMIVHPWKADARLMFYPGFKEFYRGWLALESRSGPRGSRVAYAGTNLPYYLMGLGLRNEVRYVNVDAHRGWLLHDYHRAAREGSRPATWPTPRPGWDRIHPDYDAWLANLRAEGIQLLVVTRTNRDEGAHNLATPDDFPIERAWADAHPETFEPLYGAVERDPKFRLYRVRPPKPGRP